MMMALLVFKTRIKGLYEKHYRIIRSVLKILISAALFSVVLVNLPFRPELREYAVPLVILLSLVCGFLPDVAVMCLVAVFALYEISAVSLMAAFGFFAILAIYFLLFGRYAKCQSYIVLLIPALSVFNLSYAVPVVAALFLSPAMIPACVVGVLIHYLILGITEYYVISQNAVDTGNTMEVLQYVTGYVMNNREMLAYMITFAVAFLAVFVIRKGRFNYASQIGIFVGIVICMSGVMAGDILWSLAADMNRLFWGVGLTAVVAYIIQFFRMNLDYNGARKLQFEDDEYFYYVKAVPKMKVAVVDKTITRIHEDKSRQKIDLKDEIEKVLEEDIK